MSDSNVSGSRGPKENRKKRPYGVVSVFCFFIIYEISITIGIPLYRSLFSPIIEPKYIFCFFENIVACILCVHGGYCYYLFIFD